MRIVPVILCGGIGSRLWPFSTKQAPKQFMQLDGGINMLESTMKTVIKQGLQAPMIFGHISCRWQIQDSFRKLDLTDYELILEPYSLNSLAPIVIAAMLCADNDILLILPIDQMIEPQSVFWEQISENAQNISDNIVTFGIKPTYPSTEYGYIKKAQQEIAINQYMVSNFIEKPNEAKAQQYLADGFLWNAGIFMAKASVLKEEIRFHKPEVLAIARDLLQDVGRKNTDRILAAQTYQGMPNMPFDEAVIEKSEKVVVSPAKFTWMDLGSLESLKFAAIKDQDSNYTVGDAVHLDNKNCFIHAKGHQVIAKGLENISILHTNDHTVVAAHNEVRDIQNYVKGNADFVEERNIEFRPWGYFINIKEEPGYKIKKIVVRPGQKLSLQLHHFRAEQWTVIKGQGIAIVGEHQIRLQPEKSLFIPTKEKHRLINDNVDDLEIIEIQLGEVLKEDDIDRFEDIYDRA
jgi:mannose-1-phosphate guanylyltransferase/mannose-6-phosphate isomerase